MLYCVASDNEHNFSVGQYISQSVCLLICLSVCVSLSLCLSAYMAVCLCLFACLFVLSLSVCLFICRSVCLSASQFVPVHFSVYLYVCVSVCLSVRVQPVVEMRIGDNRPRGVTRGEREVIPNNGSRTNVGINMHFEIEIESHSGISTESDQVVLIPGSDSRTDL